MSLVSSPAYAELTRKGESSVASAAKEFARKSGSDEAMTAASAMNRHSDCALLQHVTGNNDASDARMTADAELFAELDPEPRLLMGPGPVDVYPRVLRAMSVPLQGQFDPQFTALHERR